MERNLNRARPAILFVPFAPIGIHESESRLGMNSCPAVTAMGLRPLRSGAEGLRFRLRTKFPGALLLSARVRHCLEWFTQLQDGRSNPM